MTCTIHKHIMAVILAGAMLLFLGMAVQTVYADNEEYSIDVSGLNSVSNALPGVPYELTAEIKHNGQPATLPEGAECVWYAGVGPGPAPAGLPDDFVSIEPSGDTSKAVLQFGEIPDGATEVDVWFRVELVLNDGTIYKSENHQALVKEGFYEAIMPDINPDMLVQEPVKVSAQVLYHNVDGEQDVTTPVDAEWKWYCDKSVLKVEENGKQSDGSYLFTVTRLRADKNEESFKLTAKYGEGEYDKSEMWYVLNAYSHDLSKSSVGVAPSKYFSIFADNWCMVDEVAAKKAGAPTSIAMSDIFVHAPKDTITQKLSDKLFDIRVEKYVGNDGASSDDVFDLSSFPLKFDPKGTKDKNGNRTDGTALYYITLTGKAGSGWTGTTDMYLFVCSKYSLYNFQDYFLGTVEFPALAKYLKDWDKDPYMRYEVPKGNKAKKTLVVKLGNDKLTPGKQITVKYRNDKTKKEYSSFPTNKPGEYTLVITGKSPYYGKDTSTHLKIGMKNPLVVKGKTVKIKKKQIKKKSKTLKAKRVVKIKKKGKGKLTYKKLSGNKKITVASNGKVKVKKGLKKGTYKVKVSVTAAGNDQYFPITKKVTFKIKVKK